MGTSRRQFLKATGVGAAASSFRQTAIGAEGRHPPGSRPNLLLFLADDLSIMEMSCYGGGNARTPNIDRLASQGMRFDKCYNSIAMCAPTRCSLYTGLYPVRNGSYRNHTACRSGTRSMVHYLTDLGYRVGIAGKTHVGPPNSFPFEVIGKGKNRFPATWQDGTAPEDLADIREFITRDVGQPFCLVLGSRFPHPPWKLGTEVYPPDKLKLPPYWVDTPITRTRYSEYCSDVAALDRQVGAVMGLLDQTRTADRTMSLFLSEQGTDMPWGKWTCYEQGLHTGAIARWPGVVKPGSVSSAMVEYVDIVPTLITAGGGEPPKGLDGRSFLPVLQGRTDRHKKYVFGIHNNCPEGPPYPIRSVRSDRFSFIWNLTPSAEYSIKYTMSEKTFPSLDYWRSWVEKAKTDPATARLIARYVRRPEEELYDLAADPWEQHNLADKPEYEAVKKDLRAQLRGWMQQQRDSGADLDQPVEQRGPWLMK